MCTVKITTMTTIVPTTTNKKGFAKVFFKSKILNNFKFRIKKRKFGNTATNGLVQWMPKLVRIESQIAITTVTATAERGRWPTFLRYNFNYL